MPQVVVTPPKGEAVHFACDAWIDRKRSAEGKAELVLQAGAAAVNKALYRVTVTTGDLRGAGTDATVWLQVRGEGAAAPRVLFACELRGWEQPPCVRLDATVAAGALLGGESPR